MRRKLPVVECDICNSQQVDNGDMTEILGLTIRSAFFAGGGGGGSVPKDTFICLECLDGNKHHGPVLMDVLTALVFLDNGRELDLGAVYAPKI